MGDNSFTSYAENPKQWKIVLDLNLVAIAISLPGSSVFSQFDSPYGLEEAIETTLSSFMVLSLIVMLVGYMTFDSLHRSWYYYFSIQLLICFGVFLFIWSFFNHNPNLSTFELFDALVMLSLFGAALGFVLFPVFFLSYESDLFILYVIEFLLILYLVVTVLRNHRKPSEFFIDKGNV